MKLLVIFLCLALCQWGEARLRDKYRRRSDPPSDGETYALLVAGSNGWYNYRHQADVAHSYHVLRDHGIPEDNIIVMMYDDIAHNKANPYKGKLYNQPHGPDVYKGVKIDYKGKDVTPKNFMNILEGKASQVEGGNGRVINSNSKDRLFVYFTDHGSVGLIAFPDDILSAKQLNDTLTRMAHNKRFSQLVFYLEACESGSMFEKVLDERLNIYAITAANSHESSWGTYCDTDMKLPCLGDLFSVNWMMDSDEEDIREETIEYQYTLVKKKTDKSHVMQFGNVTIADEPVGWFQGEEEKVKKTRAVKTGHYTQWPSRDIELLSLEKEKQTSNNVFKQRQLTHRIKKIHEDRRAIKTFFKSVVNNVVLDQDDRKLMFTEKNVVEDVQCHHEVVHAFHNICINFNKYDYAMKYVYVLNNLCIYTGNSEDIIEQLLELCPLELV